MYSQGIPFEHKAVNPLLYRNESQVQLQGQPIESATNSAYTALFRFISALSGIPLSAEEKAHIAELSRYKKLSKQQYFLQEGEVCKYIGFIISGSTRMFSINYRGQESLIALGLEHSWIADTDSFKNHSPSLYHIETLEDTEILLLNAAQKNELKRQIPAVAEMFSRYHQQQLVLTQQRIHRTLSMTAEEQYADLQRNHHEYAQRFSQKMIAAYLGMKPQSLSRIRRRQLHSK